MTPNQLTQFFSGKTIVATGASGYLASSVFALLQDVECTLVRISRSSGLPHIPGKIKIIDVTGDITTENLWGKVVKDADVIFHFAAQTSTYTANDFPDKDIDINVRPMLMLLKAAKKTGNKPAVVFSGTSTEMGIPTELPVDESRADHPVTIYDIHKLTSELYLTHYSREGHVDGVCLRLTNVYGPGPKSSSSDRGVLNMMTRWALEGKALNIYGEGEQIRDYAYVDDVAKAFLAAAVNAKSISGKYFLLGSGKGHSIAQAVNLLADRVHALTGKKVTVNHTPPPEGLSIIEDRNFVANTKAFTRATGWKAETSLEDGIDKMILSLRPTAAKP